MFLELNNEISYNTIDIFYKSATKRMNGYMKVIYSGTFKFKAGPASLKSANYVCDIDLVEFDNEVRCVMFSERNDDKTISITNICDRMASLVYAEYLKGVPENRIIWLECYPFTRNGKAYIDLLQFDSEVVETEGTGPGTSGTLRFYRPRWHRLFEAGRIDRMEFLKGHANTLKNLYKAQVIFELEDRDGYYWRVLAGIDGLFIITSNPAADAPDSSFDMPAMTEFIKGKSKFFDPGIDLEKRFTEELINGFLNKGL
jgi:hypothetical protein